MARPMTMGLVMQYSDPFRGARLRVDRPAAGAVLGGVLQGGAPIQGGGMLFSTRRSTKGGVRTSPWGVNW